MMNNSDVIVIGAGPVGLTAALLLADAGVRVILVELATTPGDLPRAISLVDESFRTMDRIGIAEDLKDESLTDTGSRYYGRNGRLLTAAKPMPSRIGHPAKTQFDQPIMEALLFERALTHDGLDFRAGTRATGIEQDTDGVSVTVQGPGGQEMFRASWLIGADGGRSLTREALGIDLTGATQPQRWIVIDLLSQTEPREKFADFHCDGKRPYVIVPGVKGRLRIEFMLFDHEDADAMTTPATIRELVRPLREEDLDSADVRRAAVYVAHQRIARTYRVGRAFLAGDAAHLMPPFAGQGLNAGIRDASNIAWKLTEAVRGGASERLLDSYEIERRTHGEKMIKISRRIGRVVMATGPVVTRVRDATIRALSLIPPVYAFLASMRFITPPDYSDGVAVAAGKDADAILAAGIGRAFSQPQVRDASRVISGLDTHLGEGWALVAVGPSLVGSIDRSSGSVSPFAGRDLYWAGIGARFVQIVHAGEDPKPAYGFVEVADITGLIVPEADRLAQMHFVAVRPDKYVAAVFQVDDEQRVVDELRTFIDERRRVQTHATQEA